MLEGIIQSVNMILMNMNVDQRAELFEMLVGDRRTEFTDAAVEGDLVKLNAILMREETNPAIYRNQALRMAAEFGHSDIVDRLIWLPAVQKHASFAGLKNRYPIIQEAYVKKYAMLQALPEEPENYFQWLPDEMLQELGQLLDKTDGPNENEWEKIALQQEKYVNQFQFAAQFKIQFEEDDVKMEIDEQETRKRKNSHEEEEQFSSKRKR